MAEILGKSEKDLKKCSKYLSEGNLVAFPTETVYGLGANAFDVEAVRKIFKFKQRPLTDPVIVHVHSFKQAQGLIDLLPFEEELYEFLTTKFWPGPLTIVATANEKIPKVVTAGGKTVGIRSPSHPLALELLRVSQLPIAAPSANRFGHISPTTAGHVYEDLGKCPILILDGGKTDVGIESTVVKLQQTSEKKISLTVLRKGAISNLDLEDALVGTKFETKVQVSVSSKIVDHKKLEELQQKKQKEEENENKNEKENENENENEKGEETIEKEESPGTNITHYAPDKPTFILTFNNLDKKKIEFEEEQEQLDLSKAIFVDYGGYRIDLKEKVLAYTDLSEEMDIKIATSSIYSTLRWTETIENGQFVLLPDISQITLKSKKKIPRMLPGLTDRMFRSASGRKVLLNNDLQIQIIKQELF
ncbi:hypothetical protein M0813_24078 [Anaeramoeba flamelloides]|uniref:Threonylcarbamoyl-AMP synthase n=1 Tax=Anaeramoeba flamelloides TaxID=1746091 RepID=A0ABQ8Y6W0_9EUKA|nr:hypothetical protein M0813_24078 [Anaeramoeba flamelloides]